MTWAVVAGLACGLATVLISEAILRFGGPALQHSLFRVLATGIALRTLWVLAVVAWSLSAGVPDPRAFVPGLLVGYLTGQVFEGIRYGRYFERC